MRNEENNVEALIYSLKNQVGLSNVRFHLVNDNSTDKTVQMVGDLIKGDDRFTLLQSPPLAAGWLGKTATMQFGFERSASDIVVFVDADVRLEKEAIARSVATLRSLNLMFISAYPRQIAITWSEKLIQPLLQWSWMTTVPLRIPEISGNPAFCVANGQFLLIERKALQHIGGLERIRGAVLDDIFLARELVRSGFHGTAIDGSKIASCRMYSSWHELRDGYGKSLHVAFGGIFGSAIAIAFFLFAGVIPFGSALFGSRIGMAALVAVILTRVISAISCRGKMWLSILHPISMTLLIYLLVRSWVKRDQILWKGRSL